MVGLVALLAGACGGVEVDGGSATSGAVATSSPTSEPASEPATTEQSVAAAGVVDRSADLVGRWEITTYRLGDGALTNVLGDDAHLTFSTDGTLDYGTGCNQGSTGFATSGAYLVPESPLDDKFPY